MFELLSSFSFTSIRPTFNERAKQALSLFYKQIINMTLVLQCIFCKVHIIGKQCSLHARSDLLHNSESKYAHP